MITPGPATEDRPNGEDGAMTPDPDRLGELGFDRVRFGDVEIDVPGREVRRGGEPQHLEPQAFDVLVALLAARDRVVGKPELLDRVWGDQFVSESALTTRIKEVRRALGDDGTRQERIRNVRGRGYRFVAPLDEPAPTRPGRPAAEPPAAVGRASEIATVTGALGHSPVVTIVGPGGIGKTTVARAVAEAAAGRDGVVFVRLTPVTDPGDVVFAARRAAGIRGAVGDAEEVLATLAALDALVVLDNCEHVVTGAADLAKRLVERGARARVLATSRERLGVAGERVVAIDVLDRDAARALFAERASAVLPAFALDAGTIPSVDRIVDSVDRLPLAIEMAAARLAAVTPDELAGLLEERLDVLRSPDRSADDRHRTLAGLVHWSTELLDDAERRALDGFTVFAGSVTAADVDGVLGPGAGTTGPPALDDVLGLVDRSLVVADTSRRPTRYRMLSTIRAHVGVASGDAELEGRHAAWFTDVAVECDRRLATPAEAEAHHRLDGAVAEVRAAHRWARRHDPSLAARLTGALDRYAHTRLWSEPARWAHELASSTAPASVPPAVWAALAAQACHRADHTTARDHAHRVVARPDELPADPAGVASALESLADVALYDGDLATSERFATALRRFGEQTGDGYAVAAGLCGASLALAYGGHVDAALARLSDPHLEADDRVPPSGRAWLAYAAGEARALTDPEAAIPHFESALELAAGVSCHFIRTVTATSLLSARSRAVDPAAALPAFDAVLRDFRRYGSRSHSTTALRNLVDVLARAGHDETAMVLLGSLEGSAKTTYGTELQRLEAARDAVTARAGHARVSEWLAAGAARSHDPAAPVDLALAHLAAAAEHGASRPDPDDVTDG